MVSEEHFEVRKWSKGNSLKVDQLLANKRQLIEDGLRFINAAALENKHNPQTTI